LDKQIEIEIEGEEEPQCKIDQEKIENINTNEVNITIYAF